MKTFLKTCAALVLTMFVAALATMLLDLQGAAAAGLALAFPAVLATDRPIGKIKEDLAKLIRELKAGQEEMKKGPISQERGEELQQKAQEAEALQEQIDAYEKIEGLTKRAGRIRPEDNLPQNDSTDGKAQSEVAGYVTLGQYVTASEEFRKVAATGWPTGARAIVPVEAALLGKNAVAGPNGVPLVPLSREQRKAFEELRQTKAVPDLGTGVIEPERLSVVAKVTADDRLRMRDVINTGQTSDGSVEYLREESMTNNAAETAHGESKPEEAVEYSLQTAPVRTIAGWIPVHNQQLEDMPQLQSLIDGRLRYSVRRREEYQLLWGDGTAPNLQGLFGVAANIANNGRYNASEHQLLDVVRMGISDVFVAGYEPNALILHPFDWETMVLYKGTDDRYVWAVVTDQNGDRVWGLRVVETVAAQARVATDTTQARRLLVGDFQMGCQLLDRMALQVMIGWQNDQFVKNMRTILAEERVAFPIYATKAFAYFETVAAVPAGG